MTSASPANNRREFLRKSATALGAVVASQSALQAGLFAGSSADQGAAETAVTEFYKSLSDSQQKQICLPFNHKLRQKINPNWHVTSPEFGDEFYSDKQRALITRIIKGITSEDGFERLQRQMDDDSGGMDYYSAAVFGKPGEGPFEFEFTGRHLTLRADGNSVDKAAFGGPIVYGHGEEESASRNIFFYQTQQTNKVFESLDKDQRRQALVKSRIPKESAVKIQGESGSFAGLQVGEMTNEQKTVVEESLKVLLAPYRESDRTEVMDIVKRTGGVDKLHMAFYQKGDLGSDKTWDVWRIEGPAFVWHFRGAPHVHAYINIAEKA